jgi:thiamine-phosphate pyrophosphorylase
LSYAFLSPVFDSLSKPGYAAAGFDPAQVRAVATRSGTPPLIALGGVSAERLADAKGMGFSGAAVLGSVWQAADPVAAVAELVQACASLGDDDSDGGV